MDTFPEGARYVIFLNPERTEGLEAWPISGEEEAYRLYRRSRTATSDVWRPPTLSRMAAPFASVVRHADTLGLTVTETVAEQGAAA